MNMPARQPAPAASFEDSEIISEAIIFPELKLEIRGTRQRVAEVISNVQRIRAAKVTEFGEYDPDGQRTREYLLSLFKIPEADFYFRTPAREVAGVTARLIENAH